MELMQQIVSCIFLSKHTIIFCLASWPLEEVAVFTWETTIYKPLYQSHTNRINQS